MTGPEIAEARQVCSVHGSAVATWCGSTYDDVLHQITVHTPGGERTACSGDWVIRVPDGTFRVGYRERQIVQAAADAALRQLAADTERSVARVRTQESEKGR